MEKSLALIENALSVEQVVAQRELVVNVMANAMKENLHFGKVPGCGDKPTLLLPGAQTLCQMFQLSPEYTITERALDDGKHREYETRCSLYVRRVIDGNTISVLIAQGVGVCSSKETKYLMRNAAKEITWTEHPVPSSYWNLRKVSPEKAAEQLLSIFKNEDAPEGTVGTKKDDQGNWKIVFYHGGEDKVENPNPTDTFNTVLKISKKRAYVDATITATASSDLFTADLEDIMANMEAAGKVTAEAHPEQDKQASNNISNWREAVCHFGKEGGPLKGKKLSELLPSNLNWIKEQLDKRKNLNWKDKQLLEAINESFMDQTAANHDMGELPMHQTRDRLSEALKKEGYDESKFLTLANRLGWINASAFQEITEAEAHDIIDGWSTVVEKYGGELK